ncbi:MAG TPA: hypothetical protein PK640_03700 [Verrucomicrobiota bacterium]|nr:hypothetical protein [Verrucomicrobiota bacterium]
MGRLRASLDSIVLDATPLRLSDRRSYAEGNDEPESARCAAGSGEALVEAAVRLLTALRQ